MSTLFQIHAPMNTLKAMVREIAPLWHSGDSILLMAETTGYITWLKAYIDELNYDEELGARIDNIASIYVLEDDVNQLNESARENTDFSKVNLINDKQWVELTQKVDRVITLNSLS